MDEDRSGTAVRGDRFSDGPARSFLSSLTADERLFEADIAVDQAHVVMLAEQGIIDEVAASAILDALSGIQEDGFDSLPSDAEDIHEAIESAVIERVGPDGGRLHTARSRNDEVSTCLRYQFRTDLLANARATIELREVLLDIAESEAETVMAGHTHLQSAQPTTVAHWALSYVGQLRRDTGRLLDAYERVNRSPLGGAAFAGTPHPIDRDRTAALLGFDGTVPNAMDAAASRDFLQEGVSALACLATTLSGIAADTILFAHRDWLELDDDYASTSSIMPQKKNPDTLELVRASAGDAAAAVSGITTSLTGLHRAYNRDLQQITPHAWRAADQVVQATEVTAGAIETATWDEAALEAAADTDFSTATGVADRLTTGGMPFRVAHEVVATTTAALSTGASSDAFIAQLTKIISEHSDTASLETYAAPAEIRALLTPRGSVEQRSSAGGPAPAAITAQIESETTAIEGHRQVVADHYESLAAAATELATEVGKFA